MHFALVLALFVATVVAYPQNPQRIVGGSVTTINQYPYGTSLLYSWDLVSYWQGCGGGIITSTAILTAGHCVHGDPVNRWRVRVGSTWANSGGTIHTLRSIVIHPSYNSWTFDNDIAVLRTASNINYIANTVAPTPIAGAAYNLPDNAAVWAIGWGLTQFHGQPSEQLRHVQVWVFNQATCRQRFAEIGLTITDNMMCSGWLDVGGRGQCNGDSGSPVLHNGVIVGVCSWGIECATARFGSVNVRVSRYTAWIQGAAA